MLYGYSRAGSESKVNHLREAGCYRWKTGTFWFRGVDLRKIDSTFIILLKISTFDIAKPDQEEFCCFC